MTRITYYKQGKLNITKTIKSWSVFYAKLTLYKFKQRANREIKRNQVLRGLRQPIEQS